MIKLIFEFETKYGVYRDALYLEENHIFTEQEIDAMKQQRVDNWLYAIENPPVTEPEPAVEPEPVGD
jgi:hypothetical protein